MKITRKQLRNLIIEEINHKQSVLLEMPGHVPIGDSSLPETPGQLPPGADKEGASAKQKLFHMAQQANQLHDILMPEEQLDAEVQEKISLATDYIEKVFKKIMYDKGPGQGAIG